MIFREGINKGVAAVVLTAAAMLALSAPAAMADSPEAIPAGTWTRQAQEHPLEIVDFAITDPQHIWGVGVYGRVLRTTDGGTNWNPYNVNNVSAVLHSVDFADNQTGWTVGEGMSGGGLVYKTTNGGESWFQQNEPSGQRVFGVDAISPEVVMVVGGGTSFTIARRSTDGGQTWQFMDVPLNDGIFLDIFFLDNTTGWIMGLDGGIAKTTDGGLTWTAQAHPSNWGLVRVHFSDAQNGWAGGYYGMLLHTTNGGQAWIQQNPRLPEYTHVLGVAAVSPQVAWISGYGGGAQSRPFVKQTTDGGATWVDLTPSVGPYDGFASALFLDEENGWAAGAAGLWKRSGSTPPTPVATSTAIATATRTSTAVATQTPAATSTVAASQTPVATRTATNTPVASSTSIPTSSPTVGVSGTATATATAIPQACQVTFSDVTPADYFYEGVSSLVCQGAITGYADGTFRPYANATRGQLTKIITLAHAWEIDLSNAPHFSDVQPGSTFYTYVETAFNHGIINGYADGTFRPGNNVSRGQIAKIVVQARGWEPISEGQSFSDVAPGSTFHPFVEAAYMHGIINGYGDGTFRPGANATRGQIAKIVYLALR
jgi:photosystem II stability/assembly factor-like uncharacterized protein